MGITHDDQDTSKRTSKKTSKNTSRDAEDLTGDNSDDENVIKVTNTVTKPVVKTLGELFSKEDKKSMLTFKGKSTEKLITERPNEAEHNVARNNE